MIVNLVKKDFLLVKRIVAAFMAVGVLVPIVLTGSPMQMPAIGAIACSYMVILSEIFFMQSVSAEEEKNPKAIALLCAAPYPRKSFIVARYLCYLTVCAGCIVLYSAMAAVYPKLGFLNITEVLTAFSAGALLCGIYTPIAMKYGASMGHVVLAGTILLISMGPTLIVRFLRPDMDYVLSLLQNFSTPGTAAAIGASGAGFFLLSMAISVRIFSRKEL